MKQLLITIAAVVLVGCSKPPPPDISIHEATGSGDIKAVKQHLAAGTDVNAKGVGLVFVGWTPLDCALVTKEDEIANLLRKHGGKSAAADSIHIAAAVGKIELVRQHLAAGADVHGEAKQDLSKTPLYYAAAWGQKEIAELLIAKGVNVNAETDNGWTPLSIAVYSGHKETAELLIDKGAGVNPTFLGGWTPLHHEASHASISDGKEFAELLIAKGANVNARDDNVEQTPLHRAAINGHYAIAELLIAKGSDVNNKDMYQRTPLFLAIANGNNKEIAELLIAKGADVNAKGDVGPHKGKTPLDWAEGEIADLLRKHGGKTREELEAEGK